MKTAEMQIEFLSGQLQETNRLLRDTVHELQGFRDLLNQGRGMKFLARVFLAVGGVGWIGTFFAFAQWYYGIKK